MRRVAILVAAAWAATTGAASAKFYNIQLDGYCNKFEFSVDKGLVVGISYVTTFPILCGGGNIVGTAVSLPVAVVPNGSALSFAWNGGPFQVYPGPWMFYLNTTNHYWAAYITIDGKTQQALTGTWSMLKDDADPRRGAALPSISQTVFGKAGRVGK